MKARYEQLLEACLGDIRPREGFAAELLASLTHEPLQLRTMDRTVRRARPRWIVAGAVAGVVTATGVVYVAARRHHGGAA